MLRFFCADQPVPTPSVLTARVHGAGPTGALAALALADAGWRVQLRDPLPPHDLCSRSRAYALTHSSRELLEQLAQGMADSKRCPKCHNIYRTGWMEGKCPYCEAGEAARRRVKEKMDGGGEG